MNARYPSASEIMVQQDGTAGNAPTPPRNMGSAGGGSDGAPPNPVVSALQTIQTWIASMEEKGQPGIQEFKAKFVDLLQSASSLGGGGQPGAAPGQPPAPAGGQPPSAPSPGKPPMQAMGSQQPPMPGNVKPMSAAKQLA